MTYREHREAKADRLEGWADKRKADAVAQLNSQPEIRHDWAFITQPGHIPERARMIARDERAFASLDKADNMAGRASTIRDQLDESIYDDDPDAIERLTEKLASLEAKREAYKAHNKAMRKAGACSCPLDCGCRSPYQPTRCGCNQHALPGYVLSNLGGRITQIRQRIDRLAKQAARVERAEQAGGVAVEPMRGGYCSVTFSEKPAREILDALKAAGFRWAKGSWVGIADQLPDEVRS